MVRHIKAVSVLGTTVSYLPVDGDGGRFEEKRFVALDGIDRKIGNATKNNKLHDDNYAVSVSQRRDCSANAHETTRNL